MESLDDFVAGKYYMNDIDPNPWYCIGRDDKGYVWLHQKGSQILSTIVREPIFWKPVTIMKYMNVYTLGNGQNEWQLYDTSEEAKESAYRHSERDYFITSLPVKVTE